MSIITKEDYADYTEQDKISTASKLQRELVSLKENQAFIQSTVRKFIDGGHKPSDLTAVLCGRYEPFLPEIYRKEYPPVDKIVIEVAYRESIVKHAKTYTWDPDSEIAQYWSTRSKELGFSLYEPGTKLYMLVGHELENLTVEDNEFSILVATHGCASVFKARIPRVGEKSAELESQSAVVA